MDRGLKITLIVLALAAMLALAVLLGLSYAPKPLSLSRVWAALMGHGSWADDIIVRSNNAPRMFFGAFVGAALGVTGCAMQAIFRNPLASPYLLGLSSGASFGAALALLLPIPIASLAVVQPLFAFALCLGTMMLVYMLSRTVAGVRTETLILAGVAVSSLLSALTSFLTFIAPADKMQGIVFWSMGSLDNVGWSDVGFSVPIIIIGSFFIMLSARDLNVMMLGDAHAMDLGVNVRAVRLMLLFISSLVVAAAVAFVGSIGFIGLVVPHIFRLMLGPDNRVILPLCALGGAAFILLCDYVAHIAAPFYGVMPIGIVTACLGAPFFIYLLSRKRSDIGW